MLLHGLADGAAGIGCSWQPGHFASAMVREHDAAAADVRRIHALHADKVSGISDLGGKVLVPSGSRRTAARCWSLSRQSPSGTYPGNSERQHYRYGS